MLFSISALGKQYSVNSPENQGQNEHPNQGENASSGNSQRPRSVNIFGEPVPYSDYQQELPPPPPPPLNPRASNPPHRPLQPPPPTPPQGEQYPPPYNQYSTIPPQQYNPLPPNPPAQNTPSQNRLSAPYSPSPQTAQQSAQPSYQNPYQVAQNQEKPQSKKALFLLGGAAIGCFALVAVFFIVVIASLMYIGYTVPPTEIQAWNSVEAHHKKSINNLGIIPKDETAIYVYSDELSFNDSCYILTDKSMIIHEFSYTDVVKLRDIMTIEPYYGSGLSGGYVWITLHNEDSFGFPISPDYGTDKKFIRRLQELSGGEIIEDSY